MTSPEDHEKSRPEVEGILVEFDAREEMLGAFCIKTRNLIEASLEDAGIRYHSVQQRVKSRKKLREKYLDATKDYRRLDDITDLAGLRVITYYEDDIDRVAEVIRREFRIDPEKSVDKRDSEPDRFGYSALNYVCRHLEKRASDVEYKKYSAVHCEIQITSVLRHAWSEIEHEWYDLKEAYPKGIKRRFYRLAALLELAESEFLDLRKSKTQYERSVAVQVEAKVPDLAVDSVSLRSFIVQEPLVAEIDNSLATLLGTTVATDLPDTVVERRSRASILAGMARLQDLRESLERYRIAVPEFVARCRVEVYPTVTQQRQPVTRALSIHNLGMLLVSIRGVEAAVEFLKAFGITDVPWDISRQVAIAKEIVAKYSAPR